MSARKTTTTKAPSPIEGLRKTRNRADDLAQLDHPFEELDGSHPKPRLPLAEIATDLPVSTVLAAAMLHEALSLRDRRRLDRGKGLAMSVAVSSGDWMDPVEDALRRAHAWKHAFKRSGASRTSDRPEVGNDTCADVLGSGFSVLGVSTSPERFLPSALTAVADIRIALGNPSPTSVRRAIHLVTGRPLGRLPDGVARGLTPMEVAACIRAGSSPAACVRRLQAASATKVCEAQVGLGDVPVLAETFAYGQAQEWGLRLVSAIEEYRRGERSWASIEDRNIVLAGDAGTGKSTFARSLAKSAGTPIVPTSVSTWFASTGGYLNDIVKAIDAVFARAAAFGGPVVILIDETDGIPNRATVDSRHRDYWVPIISHLLLQLDSAISGANNQFIVIGATNFPERLDEALVRPGRLNRIVHIRRPDVPATAGILRQHLGDALPDADLMPLAHIGHGATGAEIAGWARGARMIARQAGREMVLDDLVDQVAPPETRSPELLLAISRHEASHAAATLKLGLGTVTTVSVVARGAYAGRTSARLHDASSMTAGELDALVVSILAGRAADQHWGEITSGSAGGRGSDLAHATALVAGKHGSWLLGESLVYVGDEVDALAHARKDAAFAKTVQSDLERLYRVARDFVRTHEAAIDRLAHRLVERRVLGGDEVVALIGAEDEGARAEAGAARAVGQARRGVRRHG
ncbi:AAA family ATPase [Methylobacterium radiotolerans]|uniref:AAA family ATPase n=1 Tax=Methylobacterium radiotolerans TaxID=31998 RepID=UPI001F18B364|nr:AAA family ATPase [Methylobacterium radiotolerans]UIY44210.1 AAA family ATPase [Methylobacterium radiotolerans]